MALFLQKNDTGLNVSAVANTGELIIGYFRKTENPVQNFSANTQWIDVYSKNFCPICDLKLKLRFT
jgi:rubredoxin